MAQSKKQIIVIGGGPAGLMAAGQAALGGANVILLEKMNRPAQKLGLTGNGRCNLTNTAPLDDFMGHFGRNGKFLRPAFGRFFEPELCNFFAKLGVKLTNDSNGRIFPKSNSAKEIADALLKWARRCGVEIITNSQAMRIVTGGSNVKGVQVIGALKSIPADAAILATGGASYPRTGSSGDGYAIAKSEGHTIVSTRPASVPLSTSLSIVHKLSGVGLGPVMVKIRVNGKTIASDSGEILFTHFGVSGPVILNISRICVDQIMAGRKPVLVLDFLPRYKDDHLDQMLPSKIQAHGKSQIATILAEHLPQRLASLLLSHNGIEPAKTCSQVSSTERGIIRNMLKKLEIEITGHRSLSSAMVTAGGVSLKEVNPQTMESRLVRGLYFAGEVLDLDADTGGFNLQAAFSTGWVAGQSALNYQRPRN